MHFENSEIGPPQFCNLDDSISVNLPEAIQNHQQKGVPQPGVTIFSQNSGFSNCIFAIKNETQLPKINKSSTYRQSNPNLLKNLIATLRLWIKIAPNEELPHLQKIWQHFQKSKKLNTKLLKLTFGIAEQGIQEFKNIIKCELPEMSENLNISKAIRAQIQIREQTLKQIHETDPEYIIKNRRVKNKQEFRKYFYEFIDQLNTGGINMASKFSKFNRNF